MYGIVSEGCDALKDKFKTLYSVAFHRIIILISFHLNNIYANSTMPFFHMCNFLKNCHIWQMYFYRKGVDLFHENNFTLPLVPLEGA